ncbi:hypothetical protein FEM03_16570 [Phragmitibacter flavus]|uniref:Uncharacterized protein n=1 Tax=Phragmitibacter flavus TaxID=2576071 RepID=A0A5R8KB98_9BACT|nr:hypothetical protein [Phragmitibacter flavus]TLD69571.1 hypothetical protein FEM03_16570 [Phragmitibacter flavus]
MPRRLAAPSLILTAVAAAMVTASILFGQQAPPKNELPATIEAAPGLMAPAAPSDGQLSAAPTTNASAPVTSSTSASKQFIVHGADLRTRSVFCLLADDTAGSLDRLLKDPTVEKLPVVIVLKTAAEAVRTGPAVTTNISQLAHGGFHLQVTVQLRQGFLTENFTDELVRILLAERILRQHKELNTTRQRVLPDWLLTGVSEALNFRNRAKPSALFAAVFRSGRVYSIDALLQADAAQLDALSRGIYEASSCALVLTLLDQPEGTIRFGKFLNALATDSKPDRELLQQQFPTLGVSNNSLEKWWSLQMATLATPSTLETMSVAETERQLDTALTLEFKPTPQVAAKSKKKSTPKPTAEAAPTPAPTPSPEESPEAEPEKEEKKSRFGLPFFKPKSKEIIFPFTKRKPADSEAEEKPEESKPEATPKPETKPGAEPAPAPVGSLPKKPASKRDISDQPAIPAAEPSPPPSLPAKTGATRDISDQPPMVPAESPAPPEEAEPEATADEKKPSALNPLNWFRKNEPAAPENPESAPAPEGPPSDTAQSQQPQTPRPTPAPAPAPVTPEILTAPLADFAQIMKRSDRDTILQTNLDRLNALKLRAHPLYRPLIADYALVVQTLLRGKDKGMSEKIAQLSSVREQIHTQAMDVERYVDTYIANHSGFSNTFEDYLKLRDQIDEELHPRSDAISQYLDALDKEYQ